MKMFIDSNVFIEYSKDNPKAVKILEKVFESTRVKPCINDVVYSEVAYIFIRTHSEKTTLN